MNFLNHLEKWLDEANVRAGSIVAAKNDEIDKELELRLHLHEPRIKRAEMDVHNVRAGIVIITLLFMRRYWVIGVLDG